MTEQQTHQEVIHAHLLRARESLRDANKALEERNPSQMAYHIGEAELALIDTLKAYGRLAKEALDEVIKGPTS